VAISQSDKRTILFGIGFLLLAALGRFLILPGLNAWGEARAEVDGHSQRVEDLSTQLNRAEAMQRRLVDKLGLAAGKKPITVDEARVQFPKAVQDALAKGGAAVSSIELQQVRKLREASGWSLVPVRVQASCKGAKIADVLNSFRASQQLIMVDRLSLDMARSGNRDNWKLEMILSTPVVQGGAS